MELYDRVIASSDLADQIKRIERRAKDAYRVGPNVGLSGLGFGTEERAEKVRCEINEIIGRHTAEYLDALKREFALKFSASEEEKKP